MKYTVVLGRVNDFGDTLTFVVDANTYFDAEQKAFTEALKYYYGDEWDEYYNDTPYDLYAVFQGEHRNEVAHD